MLRPYFERDQCRSRGADAHQHGEGAAKPSAAV